MMTAGWDRIESPESNQLNRLLNKKGFERNTPEALSL